MGKPQAKSCVVIGTSPISLMEALHLHRTGMHVQIIEKSNQIGGVWTVDEFHDLKGIERYCHILTYNRAGYRAINKLFPGKFARLEIQPDLLAFERNTEILNFKESFLSVLIRYRGRPDIYKRIISYGLYRFAHMYDWIGKNVFGLRHIYPIDGIQEILSLLSNALEKENVPIHFNQDVKSISINDRNGPIHLLIEDVDKKSKHTIITSKVVIPTRATVEEFILGEERIDLHDRVNKRLHAQIFLMIDIKVSSSFCYVHFSRHLFLRRIHNITWHVRRNNNLPENREIHIVEVKPEFIESGGNITKVLSSLIDLNIISGQCEIVDSSVYLREIPEPNKKGVSAVRRYIKKQAVQFLWTRDLSRAMAAHYPRWRETIKPII